MIDFYRKSFLNYLDSQNLTKSKSNLYEPINYLLNLEGKRFRPILTLISADCFGGKIKDSLPQLGIVSIIFISSSKGNGINELMNKTKMTFN